jgi:hypothetical protein
MIETISQMFGDRLWIYTAIAGALIGAAFLAWFKGTRAGLWCYSLFDRTLDYLVDRWGWTWLQEPVDAWRKKYPKITNKIDELQSDINVLELRIKSLENGKKAKIIKQKKETKK